MFLLAQIQLHLKHIRKGCALILGFFPPALGTQVGQGGVQLRLRHIGLVQQNVQLLLCRPAPLLPIGRQGHVCMNGSDLLLQLGAQPCKHLLMLRLHLLRCFGLRDR